MADCQLRGMGFELCGWGGGRIRGSGVGLRALSGGEFYFI